SLLTYVCQVTEVSSLAVGAGQTFHAHSTCATRRTAAIDVGFAEVLDSVLARVAAAGQKRIHGIPIRAGGAAANGSGHYRRAIEAEQISKNHQPVGNRIERPVAVEIVSRQFVGVDEA